MLRLRPYKKDDAKHIVTWCNDERDFYKWTAGNLGEFPITEERINELDNEKCYPFVAIDEEGLAGFFILRHPGDYEYELRFGFIILNPSRRGKGYGKQMLKLGIKFAYEIYGAKKLALGVFDNNPYAYYCYKSIGFQENDKEEAKIYNILGEEWKWIEMVYVKPMISSLHHVSLRCTSEEFETAKSFYTDVLKLKVARTWSGGIMFDTCDGIIEIFNNSQGIKEQGAIRHFGLYVSDVDAVAESIEKAGYNVFLKPRDISVDSEPKLSARIAFCTGPLGEEIELMKEIEG